MKRKSAPIPLSDDDAALMARIINESGPVIRQVFQSRPDSDGVPAEWVIQAEFYSGVAVGVAATLKWLKEHPNA